MITDIQLNQIIQTPPERTRFESHDLLHYFNTEGGSFQPSWKYMDRSRMLELFDRALKSPWCTDYHRRLIKDAKSEMV